MVCRYQIVVGLLVVNACADPDANSNPVDTSEVVIAPPIPEVAVDTGSATVDQGVRSPEYGNGTDSGDQRARLAANHESALQNEGCGACKVWVGGPDNTALYVLDPTAPNGDNDYLGLPVFWFNAGFTKVIYYSAPGEEYARHAK